MDLKIISSGSVGNCYILENNAEALIIEAGVRFDKIKKALDFKIGKVKGCIVSHEHLDHAKSVKDVLSAGINVWASKGTHKAGGTDKHHRSRITASGESFQVGSFKVRSFKVEHDAAEPLGFLINHAECGTVLFLTDSYYCEYTFRGLNNIMIEANYCQTIIDDRVAKGTNPKFLRDRVLSSHMSLATCKKTLAANDLTAVNNIVLLHLSEGNSDAKRFQREVQETTGKVVHVAHKNQIIPFTKTPF